MHQTNKKWAWGLVLFSAVLLGLSLGAQRTGPTADRDGTYIEVHGPDIAYVPMTAKYVKYNGKIKKVVRFAETFGEGEEDCQCPSCCKGRCYVIIFSDILFSKGPLRTLYILWIEC